jgi:hypothetical protein
MKILSDIPIPVMIVCSVFFASLAFVAYHAANRGSIKRPMRTIVIDRTKTETGRGFQELVIYNSADQVKCQSAPNEGRKSP